MILCIDCQCKITDANKGAKYPDKDGMKRYKCKECYEDKPEISQDALVYSRVVGYLTTVNNWNKGKRNEYAKRKVYKPEYKNKNEKK